MNNTILNLVKAGALVLAGLVLGWAVRGVVGYDTGVQTVSDYQDWHTACPPASVKDAACEMVENVVDSNTKSEVARITITKDMGKDVFGITMPFGVALEPGIGLIFGTDPVKVYQYRTCTSVGCLAVIPLDDKLQAQLKAGKDGRVLFAGLDNKPVALPISLKGYPEASRAWRRGEAKRSSWFWRMWS